MEPLVGFLQRVVVCKWFIGAVELYALSFIDLENQFRYVGANGLHGECDRELQRWKSSGKLSRTKRYKAQKRIKK